MTDDKKKPDGRNGAKFLGFFDKNADPTEVAAAIHAAIEAEQKQPVPPKKKRPGQEAE